MFSVRPIRFSFHSTHGYSCAVPLCRVSCQVVLAGVGVCWQLHRVMLSRAPYFQAALDFSARSAGSERGKSRIPLADVHRTSGVVVY